MTQIAKEVIHACAIRKAKIFEECAFLRNVATPDNGKVRNNFYLVLWHVWCFHVKGSLV